MLRELLARPSGSRSPPKRPDALESMPLGTDIWWSNRRRALGVVARMEWSDGRRRRRRLADPQPPTIAPRSWLRPRPSEPLHRWPAARLTRPSLVEPVNADVQVQPVDHDDFAGRPALLLTASDHDALPYLDARVDERVVVLDGDEDTGTRVLETRGPCQLASSAEMSCHAERLQVAVEAGLHTLAA